MYGNHTLGRRVTSRQNGTAKHHESQDYRVMSQDHRMASHDYLQTRDLYTTTPTMESRQKSDTYRPASTLDYPTSKKLCGCRQPHCGDNSFMTSLSDNKHTVIPEVGCMEEEHPSPATAAVVTQGLGVGGHGGGGADTGRTLRARGVCPRRGTACLGALLLVVLPMTALLSLTSIGFIKAKKEYTWLTERNDYVERHLLQIVRLVVAFTEERENAALLVSARGGSSRDEALDFLHSSFSATDRELLALQYSWPGQGSTDGYVYKSPAFFQAVLQRHRQLLLTPTPGGSNSDFKQQLRFYTDILHKVCGWFYRDAVIWRDSRIWPYLLSYTYLLSSINLLGAEQALCSVYHSVICFSHKETFLYANYSFSGEAVYKLYWQSYPGSKDSTLQQQDHAYVFPTLHTCRTDLIADVGYPGIAIEPTICDYSRKNETRVADLELLTRVESGKLEQHIRSNMAAELDAARQWLVLTFTLLVITAVYFIFVHLIRCIYRKYKSSGSGGGKHRYKWRTSSAVNREDKLAQMALNDQTTVIGYDDYRDCETTSSYIKVATV